MWLVTGDHYLSKADDGRSIIVDAYGEAEHMRNKYHNMVKHIPSLEDHGQLYMYYGTPYSDECYVYGDDEDENLIVSYECHKLCTAIADAFQYEYNWLDILEEKQIRLEDVFDVDVETQDIAITASLLLYLVDSLILEDKFMDALNNGYLIRLLKRLKQLGKVSANKSKT
jgi:hypothetical protein